MGECIVCRGPVARRSRCWTCYQYRRRTGRDRTPELVMAVNERRLNRELERAAIVAIAPMLLG